MSASYTLMLDHGAVSLTESEYLRERMTDFVYDMGDILTPVSDTPAHLAHLILPVVVTRLWAIADAMSDVVERMNDGKVVHEYLARDRHDEYHRPRKGPNSFQPWSEEDKRELLRMHAANVSISALAARFGRSEDAIANRLNHIKYGLLRQSGTTNLGEGLFLDVDQH